MYGWVSIIEHLCNLWLIALLAAYAACGCPRVSGISHGSAMPAEARRIRLLGPSNQGRSTLSTDRVVRQARSMFER
jgi:hypothetical protein